MITQYAQAINYENSSESIYTCDQHKKKKEVKIEIKAV